MTSCAPGLSTLSIFDLEEDEEPEDDEDDIVLSE